MRVYVIDYGLAAEIVTFSPKLSVASCRLFSTLIGLHSVQILNNLILRTIVPPPNSPPARIRSTPSSPSMRALKKEDAILDVYIYAQDLFVVLILLCSLYSPLLCVFCPYLAQNSHKRLCTDLLQLGTHPEHFRLLISPLPLIPFSSAPMEAQTVPTPIMTPKFFHFPKTHHPLLPHMTPLLPFPPFLAEVVVGISKNL